MPVGQYPTDRVARTGGRGSRVGAGRSERARFGQEASGEPRDQKRQRRRGQPPLLTGMRVDVFFKSEAAATAATPAAKTEVSATEPQK